MSNDTDVVSNRETILIQKPERDSATVTSITNIFISLSDLSRLF